MGFVIINILYKKKKFNGQVFLMYVTWYGFGRMLIEGLRTDSLYIGVFRISQVVGFVCFVVGAILLIYNFVKARRAELSGLAYEAAYPKLTHTQTDAADEAVEETDGESEDEELGEEEKEAINADISDKLKNLFDK